MKARWFALPVALTLAIVAGVAVAARPTKRLDDTERGKQLYERHCVQCHGATLAGDGPAAAALVAKVPDLRKTLTAETQDRDVRLLLEGKGPMPSFQTSFDTYDARRILRYMRDVDAGKFDAKPAATPEEEPAEKPPKKPADKPAEPAGAPQE